MHVTRDMSVGEVIRRCPASLRVFEIHRMVVCCAPERSLADAAERFGADEPALLRMLQRCAPE